MVGWLVVGGEDWRVRLEHTQIRGLPVLQARVPDPPGLRRRGLDRRIGRAARQLSRAGCRRAVTQPGFESWGILEEEGLRPVEGERLAQALAARVVLEQLARRGVPARRGAVGLFAHRVGRAFFEAAGQLCPLVRQLVVDAPDGGDDLARYLREEFGAAVLEGQAGQRLDVSVCFAPVDSAPEGALSLWGARPDLGGLRPLPQGEALPEQADPLALTALLWEEGRVSLEEVDLA